MGPLRKGRDPGTENKRTLSGLAGILMIMEPMKGDGVLKRP